MSAEQDKFVHPVDQPLNSVLRFLVEVIAWIAGPWAIASVSPWLIALAAIILIGLPAIFSVRGDKKQVVVPVNGATRVAIEVGLHVVAAVAPWFVWPEWAGVLSVAVVVFALLTGAKRTKWLLQGAPV